MTNIKYFIPIISITLFSIIAYLVFPGSLMVYSTYAIIFITSLVTIKYSASSSCAIPDIISDKTTGSNRQLNEFLNKLHTDLEGEITTVQSENTQVKSLVSNAIEGLVASFQGLEAESTQQKNKIFALVDDVSNKSENHYTIKGLAIEAAETLKKIITSVTDMSSQSMELVKSLTFIKDDYNNVLKLLDEM